MFNSPDECTNENFSELNRLHRAVGQQEPEQMKRDTDAKVPMVCCDVIVKRKGKGDPKNKKCKRQSEMSARCSLDSRCSATTGRDNTVQELSSVLKMTTGTQPQVCS